MKTYQLVVAALVDNFYDTLNSYKLHLTDSSVSHEDGDYETPYSRAQNRISKLSAQEQAIIFDFLTVVMTDTASMIPGMIDGTHFPPHIESDKFILKYKGEEIQGCLQDELIATAQLMGLYGERVRY